MDKNKALVEDMDKFLNEMPYRGKAYQQLVTDKDGKAHWEDQLAYEDRIEISWDGDTANRVSFPVPQTSMYYYKISDLTPSKKEIIGGTVKFSSKRDPVVIAQDDTSDLVGEEAYITGGRDGVIIVSFVDNLDAGVFIIPERGTYAAYVEANGVIDYAKSLTYGKIKQLDEKFLPILLNFNVIFTDRSEGPMSCNFTYDQIREWIESDLPIVAIYRYSGSAQRNIIISYEIGEDYITFFTKVDKSDGFNYNSDGTFSKLTPS